jgi:uncharacterized membrane protein
MRTPASIARHPLHPMLIVFPVGLWLFSLVCDIAMLAGATSPGWQPAAFYTMVGGLIGALAAAVPGFIDLLSLRAASVRRIALTHMTLNLVVVALYAVNIWLRMQATTDMRLPVLLSVVAVILLAVSGWLGGEMVHVHRVGVEDGTAAHEAGSRARVPDERWSEGAARR